MVLNGFLRNEKGNFALIGALIIGMLSIVGIGAIDIARVVTLKSNLQEVTDSAALTAARELGLRGKDSKNINAILNSVAKNTVIGVAQYDFTDQNIVVKSEINKAGNTLAVVTTLNTKLPPFLKYGFGMTGMTVAAKATFSGQPNVCVIGLDNAVDGALETSHTSRVIAKNCAVYANSKSPRAIKSASDSYVSAEFICSAGGYQGELKKNYSVDPLTNCPSLTDPLIARLEPQVGPCDHKSKYDVYKDETLNPGVYCGGISISGTATATFNPGTYIIKDGQLALVQ